MRGDSSSILSFIQAQARVHGERAYLALLNDREHWNASPIALQDRAIDLVSAQLSPSFTHIETREWRCGGASHRLATYIHGTTSMIFQLLPGGSFEMGSRAGFSSESPPHTVTLSQPFLLARYPVLYREWSCYPTLGTLFGLAETAAARSVSWIAACAWLSEVGDGFRLPTEQEWEYGARAGTTGNYFWGAEVDPHYCWYWENSASGARDPQEHSLRSNAFGLVDMLGNVKEWCEDLWRSDYKQTGPTKISNNIPAGRITRGGSFRSGAEFLRCSSRSWHRPEWRAIDLGFRVARSISGFRLSMEK